MKNSKHLKTVLTKATLIAVILFGTSSCNNKQKMEEEMDVAQSNNDSRLENPSSDNQIQFRIRNAEVQKKKNTASQMELDNTIIKKDNKLAEIKNEELYNSASINPSENKTKKSETDVAVHASHLENQNEGTSIIKPNMVAAKIVGGVNTKFAEIGPVVSPNGKTIYFSRYQHPDNFAGKKDDEDIWFADWDEINNKWGEAKNIGAPLNNKYPNFINSVSPDGNTLLLGNIYLKNGKMGPGLSSSNRTSTGWSFPKEMVIEGSSKQPAVSSSQLSNNEKILLLSYEQQKNTCGGQDIYVSFIKSDNIWSVPINLGSMVNTMGTETAPFLADDDSTLYFTSEGLLGYGGNDIYVTHRLDDSWQNWSQPKNLGSKVNTATDQSFFEVTKGKIYYSSAEADGNFDVYTLTSPEEAIKLKDSKPVVLVADEKVINDTTRFFPASVNFNISSSVVFFDFDKWELTPLAKTELDKVANLLIELSFIQIDVAGFTDNVGSEKYNYDLSQKRVNAVIFYFKDKFDVDINRMTVKSFGEGKPLTNNETTDGRQLNRRVEMSIKSKLLVKN